MKERLTGAIILVALIVLLVPELLTGPIKSAPAVPASQAEDPPLRSYTINLGEDAQAAAQPAPQPLPPAAPAPAPSAPATPPPPAPAAAPEPKAKPAPAPAHAPAPTAPSGSGFMVQLGSFASRSNAERLVHQLQGQGFSASVSQGSGARHLYRVRVGPAPDHQAATQLQSKLKAAGHSGSIVPK